MSQKFGVFNTDTGKQVGDSFASEEAAKHKCASLIESSGDHFKVKKVSEAARSFEDLQQALDQALLEGFGLGTDGYRRFNLVETFPDYVIARGPDGDLYQISYTIGADDDAIAFGDPQEVETAYVPVAESARFLAVEAGSEDGWSWPVQVMQSGWASGQLEDSSGQILAPHYFPPEVVAQVAQAVNGARFRRRHPETGDGSNAPELTAGWISNGRMAGSAAQATVNLLKSETEMRSKLMAAREAGKLDLFSVSIFGYFGFKGSKIDGKPALVATGLQRFVGLDMCAEPGAGGRFLQVAASRDVLAEISALQKNAIKSSSRSTGRETGSPQGAGRISGGAMKNTIMKVLEALRKQDAGRAAEFEKEFKDLAEDKHVEFMARVSEALASATQPAPARSNEQTPEILAKAQEALAEAKKVQFGATLERKLAESKLPAPAVALVREHFAGITADEAAVDAYVVKTREAFAAFSNVGRVGSGGTVEVGRESRDKIQLAMDAMLGVKEARADKTVRPFRGIREAYIHCTGDAEMTFGQGGFYRVSEAVATTDFPNILLSSLTKKLIQDYTEYAIVDQLNTLYVTSRLGDYKTQDRVRMGYLSDLSTVAEAGPYLEGAKPTDEKISYTISKRGNLFTISEETIRNDDLNKIAQYPARMARAARHTLAAFITNFFTTPPNYDPDGLAWFHATHNNTGVVALSSAELDARAIILGKQSEKDSLNRLGLRLWGIMIPLDLKPTALQINNNMTGTNNYYQYFGQNPANPERIIVNPLMTDVNDWIGFSNPAEAPFLEIGFLDGYETPQIFLANLPTQGTQFTNDQLQYKVKHVYGGKPIDFRGVFKEVVP